MRKKKCDKNYINTIRIKQIVDITVQNSTGRCEET